MLISKLIPPPEKSSSDNDEGKFSIEGVIIKSSQELELVTSPFGQVALVRSENDNTYKPKLPSKLAFEKLELEMIFGPRLLRIIVFDKLELLKSALSKLVSINNESVNIESDKFAPLKLVPVKSTPLKSLLLKSAFCKSRLDKSTANDSP